MQKERRGNTSKSGYTLGRPLRQVWGVLQEMSRMLEMAHSADARPGSRRPRVARHWEPVVTEMPAGGDLLVYFELPDVEHEDIDLTLHGNSIVVSGVRKELPSLENVTVEDFVSGNLNLGPVQDSPFKSSVELPGTATEDDVEAAFGAGLLQVRVVGAAEDRSRRIHVRGAKKPRG
ncbi:Hsp20/alpha crystallin family protein [Rubrobacter aplysinae]|uniref:Hsp20/alpha crystallin family protein n=1 Tax=Rubrobacter aplysinae TaxID=909625 RepID=UPI00064BE0B5|nr:Hsp20/alpha crystallin family protein [Rubrobacter aplysinae]